MTDDHTPSTQETVITDDRNTRKPEHCTFSPDFKVEPPSTESDLATTVTDHSEHTTVTNTHEHKLITDASGGAVSQDKSITDQSQKSTLGVGVVTDRVQNRASVITVRHLIDRLVQDEKREMGETDSKAKRQTDKDEVAAECTTTFQLSTEVSADESLVSKNMQNPGKVIVTKVTINSLTVTIKEAMTAEGFFSSYGLQV